MLDATPAPFGEVTRRFTHLDDDERDRQVSRLLGRCGPGDPAAHVETPTLDDGVCYRRLVAAAVDGDPVGLGWLATSHRPLLVARGRVLLEHDPSEWGAVCLEVLYRTLAKADLSESCWLRRRVARQLTHRLGKIVAQHLDRRRHERPVATGRLPARHDATVGHGLDDQLELSDELSRALAEFDAITCDALVAMAIHEPLYHVADRHGISYTAVRQRLSRARRALRCELAAYRPSVG